MTEKNKTKESGRKILLKGGTVFTETGFYQKDVLLADGVISAMEDKTDLLGDCEVFEIDNCLVTPGFVDLHTHLRQPGQETAETIYSGARAAALGGYTSVTAMPNTDPVTDNLSAVAELRNLASAVPIEINIAGSITKGRKGESLSPIAEMAAAGVRLFTDDGTGVQDGQLMRQALSYVKNLNVILAQHCEDETYCEEACINEGEVSAALGLRGRPALAEEIMVYRDLALVRQTGSRMHFMHISSGKSLELIKQAKAARLPVTAEVTPHHLSMTESLLRSFDPLYKVHPPLRAKEDLYLLREAFRGDVIDILATDHAPHSKDKKEQPIDSAAPGMLGLQTAFSAAYAATCLNVKPLEFGDLASGADWTDAALQKALAEAIKKSSAKSGRKNALLHEKNGLFDEDEILSALSNLLYKMSVAPAKILGLSTQGLPLKVMNPANICVLDLGSSRVLKPEMIASLSSNSPFIHINLPGLVRHTFVNGLPVVVDQEAMF